MNRTNIRHRAVDLGKPLQIVKDINELIKKEDNPSILWVKETTNDPKFEIKALLDMELKKIADSLEKRKPIVIPSQTGEGKFTSHPLAYNLEKIPIPKNYIIYSEKNRLEPKGNDYEVSTIDINFLKFENYFISEKELEKIISALENDINKGEMTPNELVKEIISSIIPDKKQHVDKIIRYWHTRREECKKSLLRKFWKDQKYTDKYLKTTFNRRDRDKMKTRKNKKNEMETVQKMRDIKESTQKYLLNMVQMMKEREITKKNILILNQLEFEAEINMIRNEKTNVEDKYREFIKNLPKPVKPTNHPNLSPKIQIKDDKPNMIDTNLPNTGEKTDSSLDNTKPTTRRPPERPSRPRHPTKMTKLTSTNVVPVNKYDQKKIEKPKPESNITLKHRIRFNKYGNLVIDRHIQRPNSFDPFDDDFNNLVGSKVFGEDFAQNTKSSVNFDGLFVDFLKGKFSNIISSDSDEEASNFNSHLRGFSLSYKHFLKQKRNYSEISMQ